MPMTGMFTRMADGNHGNGGSIALLFWCVYFLPIGILSFGHFTWTEKDTLLGQAVPVKEPVNRGDGISYSSSNM